MTYAASAAWLRPRLWVAAVVGCVPWVVWMGSLAYGGWFKDAEGTLIGGDHLAFYTAAHLIREGQPERMYSYLELVEYQRSLIGWEWGGFEAYRNPPFYALLYLPTAGLSFYTSLLIWTVLGFGLLALAVWLLDPQRPIGVLLWSLTFYPVFATVSFGQNTLLSLAIFAGVYRLLETNRRFGAGLVAGLLWFKPQLLLGLFIWWLFSPRQYWRCWLGVAVAGAVLAAISWGVLPTASQAFVDNRDTIISYHGFGLWNVQTPKVFFQLLLPDWPLMSQMLAGAATVSGIAIAYCIARRSHASVAAMFPVAVFLSLWASPHALIYEWTLLIAACVVLWNKYPERRDAWLCLFVMTWLAFVFTTTLTYVEITKFEWYRAVQVSIPILAVVGWQSAWQLLRARSVEEQC
jgi:alpha-1,2-mannosyltransferase